VSFSICAEYTTKSVAIKFYFGAMGKKVTKSG
jgi:hypothetical protein